ncbi:type 4 pilus major pilin [Limnobacter sp.]|uniref:type 4 pilus major pilin n=1 Tax=Limnobacter sp. TaxID=2003368 RepID=UPI0027328EDD|nr:type 4 pilus major pilin [Limnobacter sp.]MDP3273348.1 type 4 pilus major pilin [Limnobacter sp.]
MITSHTLNARRKQSGITLIEVSIGLIIAAIVAAAAFIAFQNNARRTEVQDNIKQITEVISETKQKIGSTSGYAGLDNTVATQLAILTAIDQDNSYGGDITLADVDGNENLATLTWTGVEGDQCTDIILAVANGITNVTGVGDVVPVTNGQIALADTADVCGDGEAPVTLVMEFGRR